MLVDAVLRGAGYREILDLCVTQALTPSALGVLPSVGSICVPITFPWGSTEAKNFKLPEEIPGYKRGICHLEVPGVWHTTGLMWVTQRVLSPATTSAAKPGSNYQSDARCLVCGGGHCCLILFMAGSVICIMTQPHQGPISLVSIAFFLKLQET